MKKPRFSVCCRLVSLFIFARFCQFAAIFGIFLASCLLMSNVSVQAEVVTIDFENARTALSGSNYVWNETSTGYYFRGDDGTESAILGDNPWMPEGYEARYFSLGNGVSFNNVFNYSALMYEYWHGFAFSNKSGFSGDPNGNSNFWLEDGNQFTSFSGGGANGSEYYAVIYDGDSCGMSPAPTIQFDETVSIQSFALNNTPWPVYGSVLGDSFAGSADPGFWYRLTVTGRNALGEVTGIKDVMLIDYLGEELNFIEDWTTIEFTDLSADDIFTDDSGEYLMAYGNTPDDVLEFAELLLAGEVENSFENVDSLEFRVSGTDGGMWGLNIAAYFALDDLFFLTSGSISGGDLPISSVPEPGTLALLLAGLAFLGVGSLRRKVSSRLFQTAAEG